MRDRLTREVAYGFVVLFVGLVVFGVSALAVAIAMAT